MSGSLLAGFPDKPTPTTGQRKQEAEVVQTGASAASSAASAARTSALTPLETRLKELEIADKERKNKEAAAIRAADQKRALEQAGGIRNDAELMLQAVNRLRSLVDQTTTGYGAAMSNWPASRATEVRSMIKQIQSLKFFTQVNEMKAQSGKGSTGIGRILQSEIPMFLGKWGELRQTRDAKSLLYSLGVVDNQTRRIVAKAQGADIDNTDPKVAYMVRQQYGIREPGEVVEKSLKPSPAPAITASKGEFSALKPGESQKAVPIPAPMQEEYQNYVLDHLKLGNLDPDKYAAFREGLDKKYGFGTTPETFAQYNAEAKRMLTGVGKGAALDLGIPPVNAAATAEEKAKAEAVASPWTGSAIAAATGFTGGLTNEAFPSLVAGLSDKTDEEIRRTAQAYESAHPLAAGAGRFTGAVGQTLLAPELYANYAIPMMTASGAMSGAFTTPEDRVAGAIRGGATNLLLGTGTKALGTVARGAGDKISRLAQTYNVPLTFGQLMESPWARAAESTISKIPIVGNQIKKRFDEGLLGFNQSAFDDALKDIGGPTAPAIGQEGINNALTDIGGAYDAALRGVRVPVTSDFRTTINDAIEAAGEIDPQYTKLLRKELGPLLTKRVLSGADVQQVLTRVRSVSAAAREADGGAWKNYVLPHINTIEKATTDAVDAVAPKAAAGLNAANAAYRKTMILADSVNKHLDEGGVFTPQTLLGDVKNNVEAFEGAPTLARAIAGRANGKQLPLLDLAQQAANTKTGLILPDSVKNIAIPASLAGVAAGEAGIEHVLSPKDENGQSENDLSETALRNAAILGGAAAIPSLLYSKPVQQSLSAVLSRVPDKSLASLLAQYAPAGATSALRGFGQPYTPPIDMGPTGDIAIPQLPRGPKDLSTLPPAEVPQAAGAPQGGEGSGLTEIEEPETGRFIAKNDDGTYFYTDNGAPAPAPKFAHGGRVHGNFAYPVGG